MRLILVFFLFCLMTCACSHLKSVYNAPSKKNTCANLQRQMMFSNTASGNKSQWDVQSEQMQLEYAYRQANCYQIMQQNTDDEDTTSTSNPKADAPIKSE